MDKEIIDFYTKLKKLQEPLGIDFQKVLDENLWGLYESSKLTFLNHNNIHNNILNEEIKRDE